jgi:secondary thiamine-phosphate synthase enzyme
MKILSEVLRVTSNERLQLMDITARVVEIVRKANIRQGLLHLCSLHTTAAVFLNEWQSALAQDFRNLLGRLVKDDEPYTHNDSKVSDCERGNAAAHLRGLLLNPTVSIQIADGAPVLGRFQSIIFAELDGPQERKLNLQLMGE